MIINFFLIIIVITMSEISEIECRDKPNVIKKTIVPREKQGQTKPTTPKNEPTSVPLPPPTQDEEVGLAIEKTKTKR